MNSFRRYAVLMVVLLVATTLYLPWKLGVTYPKPLGPSLTVRFKDGYKTDLIKSQADIAMIGDSILRYSVDPARFSELTGLKVFKLDIPGSASAAWYLAIKNVFAAVPHKPRYVLVTFRDTILTVPGYRVNGIQRDFLGKDDGRQKRQCGNKDEFFH